MSRISTLAKFLKCNESDITKEDDYYEYQGERYFVFTEVEAITKASENIKATLWAFNTEFIFDFINFPKGCNTEAVINSFRKMQEELCEGANEIIALLIGDKLDEFIKKAIKADGVGHFLSQYDGLEHLVDDYSIFHI